MKYIYLFFFIFFTNKLLAQQQLTFQYDAAGNQISREVICVNCTPAVASVLEEILPPAKDSLLAGRQFSAYPNPVTEILNLQWKTGDESYLKIIDVFSVNGTSLQHKVLSSKQTEATLSFFNLSPGMYILRAVYSDGRQESLKVLKQ